MIDLPRHNANFCPEHFTRFCRDQVERAISDFDMVQPEDRILVAVSGGKDSLAVWDLLLGLGYAADGLYIGLGIDYGIHLIDRVEELLAAGRALAADGVIGSTQPHADSDAARASPTRL